MKNLESLRNGELQKVSSQDQSVSDIKTQSEKSITQGEEMDLQGIYFKTTEELSDIKNQIANLNIHEADEIDKARIQGDMNLLQTQLARKQTYLKKVAQAIEKHRLGTFGICDECGCDIEQKRLIINPAYDCCTPCQEYRELNAKRLGVTIEQFANSQRAEFYYA